MLSTAECQLLASRLRLRNERLFVIEAGSGGVLQAALSAPAGASAWFVGGICCYADELKTGWLGLRPELIQAHGAVSDRVVEALAEAALARTSADWVVAESGIYGPGGGRPEKPVGLVFLCVAHRNGKRHAWRLQLQGERTAMRQLSARSAVQTLCQLTHGDPAARSNLG